MMTYEQKFGRVPDDFEDLDTPPEEWQFEDPLVTVGKDGAVKSRLESPVVVKARPPRMRPISEILNKEVEDVTFLSLPMDKQIKLVAEEHNKGVGPAETRRKLGIKGASTYYDRLEKAKAMGLIRGASLAESSKAPGATADDFTRLAEDKRAQVGRLAKEAEILLQAGRIALAIEELLGDKAGTVIEALYSEVAV